MPEVRLDLGGTMREPSRIEVEARVRAAVANVLADAPREDDLVEFKAGWPEKKHARQLAGSANRAGGDPIIWVLGVDEKAKLVGLTATMDPADWWAQLRSRFHQAYPELVSHTSVEFESNEVVMALLFRTDQAPYLVTNPSGGSPELEVPIRDLTGTRSANRGELLRMLIPSINVPSALLLDASLDGIWYAEREAPNGSVNPERIEIHGHARVFFEHNSGTFVNLPEHLMEAFMSSGERRWPLGIHIVRDSKVPPGQAPNPFGVTPMNGGVVVSGPGLIYAQLSATIATNDIAFVREADEWQFDLQFGVASSDRTIDIGVALHRVPSRSWDPDPDVFHNVGVWVSRPTGH